MATAHARHILVSTEDQANELKTQITDGADFGDMAKQHSSCPSSAKGGDLGQFGPGQMVPEFDTVIWSEAIGAVHGPVQTSFVYHLIEIVSRTD
jgi:peptidyl-prolyl cis-trans isomerase C